MTTFQYYHLAAFLISAPLVISGCEEKIEVVKRPAPKNGDFFEKNPVQDNDKTQEDTKRELDKIKKGILESQSQ
jgi:hypothetical protein